MRRFLWAAVLAAVAAGQSDAAIITSAGGYQVGVTSSGGLIDSNVGFRRSDGYDPLNQGRARFDGWGDYRGWPVRRAGGRVLRSH